MPFGTRGGFIVEHNFPADGEYELTIGDMALAREVPRMEFENTVIALLDGKEFYRTTIGGEADHKAIDQTLDPAVERDQQPAAEDPLPRHRRAAQARDHVRASQLRRKRRAGSHDRARRWSGARPGRACAADPRAALGHRHERVGQPSEDLHLRAESAAGRSGLREQDRREPRTARLPSPGDRRGCESSDGVLQDGIRDRADSTAACATRLSAILASPHFLYRAESGVGTGATRTLSDLELASRLSFFLWSSLPDDELVKVAAESRLSKPDVLAAQVSRMLADPRAESLSDDFAFQWLHLSKLDEITPDRGQFPHASGLLDPRALFKEELRLFVDSVLRSDQSVFNLLTADYTFLNERVAMLYGIETVKGSHFRRVALDNPARRGLLGKGAILMMTAYPNRTSPVLRGAWILDRLLGTPPSDPPLEVPSLPENRRGQPAKTLRARLEQHREKATCFACHGVMDPLGFALENFNAVGQYRVNDPDTQTPIEAAGQLPDGTAINGPDDLRKALVDRPDHQFVQALTENLMTYALGRSLDYHDMPTVRRIVREAAKDDYRFKSIVLGVVSSDAFRKREAEDQAPT